MGSVVVASGLEGPSGADGGGAVSNGGLSNLSQGLSAMAWRSLASLLAISLPTTVASAPRGCRGLARSRYVAHLALLAFSVRRLALLTLLLALNGVGENRAGASTLNNDAPRRWRLVNQGGGAPRSQLIPAALPPSTGPVITGQSILPPEPDQALPADAQVAAAPIPLPYLIRPSLGGGVPTGFVGGWGDYFLSASAGTPGNLREGSPDASFNVGFGIGDPEKLLGVELYAGIGSFKTFNANGSFGASVGRLLVNNPDLQLAVAGGVIDAFSYGTEANPQPINGYGAITAAMPLFKGSPRILQFTLGGGGSSFAAIDTSYELTSGGMFGSLGIEVLENLGFSVGVSGRSTNVVLSWIPLRSLPIFVNLMAADVAATTPWGTVGVLTMGWGDNLKSGFVTR